MNCPRSGQRKIRFVAPARSDLFATWPIGTAISHWKWREKRSAGSAYTHQRPRGRPRSRTCFTSSKLVATAKAGKA